MSKSGPSCNAGEVEHLPPPNKSSEDGKEYSVLQLANGVVATIISSLDEARPEQTLGGAEALAACAVTVRVGSFKDPDDALGLAHLLEHVLTTGSDKYPNEKQLEVQLGSNCGTQDAVVDCERTTFFFECRTSALSSTMAMFARCFVAPTLNWDTVRRERQSVDSEFFEIAQSDSARRLQLICSCASATNPARKFSWGHLKTLADSKEKLLKALDEFKQLYYTGGHIKVAVQASLSGTTLEQLVSQSFTEVPADRRSRHHSVTFHESNSLFDMAKLNRIFSVQSTNYTSELSLSWILRPLTDSDGTHPLEYLSYVVGAEGEGSLIHQLRERGLALFLTAEAEEGGLTSNSFYTIFTICVTITDAGRRNTSSIIRTIFDYLKMLETAGASPTVYDELKSIADLNFKYQESPGALNNVVAISQNMATFPSEKFLTGKSTFANFDGAAINEYLENLKPSTVNIMLHRKAHERPLDQEEHWFKTKYRTDPIPAEWLRGWEAAAPLPAFSLPKPNPYLPTVFELVNNTTTFEPPNKLNASPPCEIWHKQENLHRLPTGSVHLMIHLPTAVGTAKSSVIRSLLLKMLAYQMIEELFRIHVAGIETTVRPVEWGIEISLFGFSHKMPDVLKALALGLTQLKDNFNETFFNELKSEVKRTTLNVLQDGAALCRDIRKSLMCEEAHTSGEKYEQIESINKKEIIDYCTFSNASVQALVRGNLSRDTARTMMEEFVVGLNLSGPEVVERRIRVVKQFPPGTSTVKVHTFNGEDVNCYTEMLCQLGFATSQEAAALQLIVAAMKKPLANELRLKNQLSYSLSVHATDVGGALGLVILVYSQVDKFSAENAQSQIEDFLAQFLEDTRRMTAEQFVELRSAYLDRARLQRPFHLLEEVQTDWLEIQTSRFEFNRREIETAEIAQLDKSVFDSLAARLLGNEGHKVVVQAVGHRPRSHQGQGTSTASQPSSLVEGKIVYSYVSDQTGASVSNFLSWKESLPNLNKTATANGLETIVESEN